MELATAISLLNAIEELVLVISCKSKAIIFANEAFYSRTMSNLSTASESINSWWKFLENVEQVQQHTQTITFDTQLNHPLHGTSNWRAKMQLLEGRDEVCCIFTSTFENDTKKKPENYWSMLDELNEISCCWLEYHEEVDDVCWLQTTKRNSQLFGMKAEDMIGRYEKRDIGIKSCQVNEEIALMKRALKEGSVEVAGAWDLPMGILYGNFLVSFIGYSSCEKKRPRFVVYAQYYTVVPKFPPLEEAKKEYNREYAFEISVLNKLVAVSPILLGVIEMFDNDTRYKIVNANPTYANLLKKTPRDLIGRTSDEIGFDPVDVKRWLEKMRESEVAKKAVSFEFATENFGVFSCIGLHISGDRFCFLSIDISEIKRLTSELKKHQEDLEDTVKARTAQLEEAVEVKGRFLAVMSHEMRTPLTGLTAALGLLSESPLMEEQQELTKIAGVCGNQLLVVINDILDLSKMEENKLPLEKLPVDVLKVMEDSLDIIAMDAEKKNLEVILDVDNNIPHYLIGDPVRIRQILVNLLTNGVKFTEKGEVRLKVECRYLDDSQCEFKFSVADTGIGIKEDAKFRIFQPFTQADSSVTRKYGGSGLGLAITKRIVELMGGTIGFESVEGKGSTFYVSIKAVFSNKNGNLFKCNYEGKRILLVSSCPSLLSMLADFFRNIGFHTFSTSSPNSFSQGQRFDIALIDVPSDSQKLDTPFNVYQQLMDTLSRSGTAIITSGTKSNELGHFFVKKPLKLSSLVSTIGRILKEIHDVPCVPTVPSINNSSMKILLVEDNLVNQKVIVKVLHSIGYDNVQTVENGLESVKAVGNNCIYDVILMDIMMPIMGGIEATQLIRQNLPKDMQPIIFALTANAFQEDKKKCMEVGMNATITKPINKNELIAYLRDVPLRKTCGTNLPLGAEKDK